MGPAVDFDSAADPLCLLCIRCVIDMVVDTPLQVTVLHTAQLFTGFSSCEGGYRLCVVGELQRAPSAIGTASLDYRESTVGHPAP